MEDTRDGKRLICFPAVELPFKFIIDSQGLTDIGIQVDGSLLFISSKEGKEGGVDHRIELSREGILLLLLGLGACILCRNMLSHGEVLEGPKVEFGILNKSFKGSEIHT